MLAQYQVVKYKLGLTHFRQRLAGAQVIKALRLVQHIPRHQPWLLDSVQEQGQQHQTLVHAQSL